MNMSRRVLMIVGMSITLSVFLFLISAVFGLFGGDEERQEEIDAIVDSVLQARMQEGELEISFGSDSQINVLLLGLDARIEDTGAHCDAIHLFTLDIENWNMTITSVPRGTYAYIPQKLADTDYYLANACFYEGLDYGIEQIEKVLGVHADYVITVNFSQTTGILRLFELPTTETLEWLRHRQSYQIGDPQRSHNQAVFIKDMIINHLSKFRNDFTLPMQYLVYSFVDTDLEFADARVILQGFIDSGIDSRGDNIILKMSPYFETVDYHFDASTIREQITIWEDRLRPYLSTTDLTGVSYEDIQASIIAYLKNTAQTGNEIEHVIDNQLWLQIDDEQIREQLQYDLAVAYCATLNDPQEIIDFVSIYILEQEVLGNDDWAQKGKELLASMVE